MGEASAVDRSASAATTVMVDMRNGFGTIQENILLTGQMHTALWNIVVGFHLDASGLILCLDDQAERDKSASKAYTVKKYLCIPLGGQGPRYGNVHQEFLP